MQALFSSQGAFSHASISLAIASRPRCFWLRPDNPRLGLARNYIKHVCYALLHISHFDGTLCNTCPLHLASGVSRAFSPDAQRNMHLHDRNCAHTRQVRLSFPRARCSHCRKRTKRRRVVAMLRPKRGKQPAPEWSVVGDVRDADVHTLSSLRLRHRHDIGRALTRSPRMRSVTAADATGAHAAMTAT